MSGQEPLAPEPAAPQSAGPEPVHPESVDREPDEIAARAAQQVAQLEDSWRRTAAELDNVRKRCASDVVRAREQERAAFALRWLPVLDNLELALEHAAAHPDHIVEGVRAVRQQALAVLADLGFPRRDDELGVPFDPARHEAVSTVADAELVPGTVAHVIRPGYGRDGEILRPASVTVATRGA